MLRLRLRLAAAAVLAVCGACVDDAREGAVPTLTGDAAPNEVRADLLGAQLADLAAAPEDVAPLEKQAGADSYLADTRLWSLRTGPRLRATLQVGRFVADAAVERRRFQDRIVSQIGQSAARRRTLSGVPVYVTASNQQSLYVWFKDRHLLVLSVAADYGEPRALLRAALGIEP